MDKKCELLVLDAGALAGVRGGDGPFSPSAYGYGYGLGGSATALNRNQNENANFINLEMPEEEHRGLLGWLLG